MNSLNHNVPQDSFHTPDHSTDFLEKPQNLRERRATYRWFYNNNPEVSTFIDFLCCIKCELIQGINSLVFNFYKTLCSDLKLNVVLIDMTREYYLFGNVFPYAELGKVDETPSCSRYDMALGRNKRLKEKIHYFWKNITFLPPDQVRVRKNPLRNDDRIEYMPDPETLRVMRAVTGQSDLCQKSGFSQDTNIILLNTDPYEGSHVFHMAKKNSSYDILGTSILERHMNELNKKSPKLNLITSPMEAILLGERLRFYVEDYLFKPLAIKNKFINSKGDPIYPSVHIETNWEPKNE